MSTLSIPVFETAEYAMTHLFLSQRVRRSQQPFLSSTLFQLQEVASFALSANLVPGTHSYTNTSPLCIERYIFFCTHTNHFEFSRGSFSLTYYSCIHQNIFCLITLISQSPSVFLSRLSITMSYFTFKEMSIFIDRIFLLLKCLLHVYKSLGGDE